MFKDLSTTCPTNRKPLKCYDATQVGDFGLDCYHDLKNPLRQSISKLDAVCAMAVPLNNNCPYMKDYCAIMCNNCGGGK